MALNNTVANQLMGQPASQRYSGKYVCQEIQLSLSVFTLSVFSMLTEFRNLLTRGSSWDLARGWGIE